MIEIVKDIGTVEPLKHIVTSIDITNDSNIDCTIVGISSDTNIQPISDYTNVIIPAQMSLEIGYNIISDYFNFQKNVEKKTTLNLLFDTTSEIVDIKFRYTLSSNNYVYLFKINNLDFIKKDLIIIIEYYCDTTEDTHPDLSIIKINSREIILGKKVKINRFTFGYFFSSNSLWKRSITENMFIISSKNKIKIKDLYLKVI